MISTKNKKISGAYKSVEVQNKDGSRRIIDIGFDSKRGRYHEIKYNADKTQAYFGSFVSEKYVLAHLNKQMESKNRQESRYNGFIGGSKVQRIVEYSKPLALAASLAIATLPLYFGCGKKQNKEPKHTITQYSSPKEPSWAQLDIKHRELIECKRALEKTKEEYSAATNELALANSRRLEQRAKEEGILPLKEKSIATLEEKRATQNFVARNESPSANYTNKIKTNPDSEYIEIPGRELKVLKTSPMGKAYLAQQAKETKQAVSIEVATNNVVWNQIDQYRINATEIDGSRDSKENFRQSREHIKSAGKELTHLLQPQHMNPLTNAKKAGKTLGGFLWNTFIEFPYATLDAITGDKILKNLNDDLYQKNPAWFRPFGYLASTVPKAFDTTIDTADIAGGIPGSIVKPALGAKKQTLESLEDAVAGTANLPRKLINPKKEKTNRFYDWIVSVPLKLGFNSIELEGFGNPQNQKALESKGYPGAMAEMLGSGAWLGWNINNLTKDKGSNGDNKNDNTGGTWNQDGGFEAGNGSSGGSFNQVPGFEVTP